jgi:glycosyltransferase involved in cell wall biosynthesis
MKILEVDVLLPFHRKDKFLDEAIQSIKKSIDVKANLILIDDRKEPARDELIPTVQTFGIGYEAALNAAKAKITSEYVAIMNSDDLMAPDRLIKQIQAIHRSDSVIAVSRMFKISSKNHQILMRGGNPRLNNFYKEFYLVSSHYANATWLAKSEYWVKNVEFPNEGIGSDWLLGSKIMQVDNTSVLSEKLYSYRLHKQQVTLENHEISTAIHDRWTELNLEFGFPNLSSQIGTKLIFPQTNKIVEFHLNNEDINQLASWLYWFNYKNQSLASTANARAVAFLIANKKYSEAMKMKRFLRTISSLTAKQLFNGCVSIYDKIGP